MDDAPNYDELAAVLEVLASPTRLRLMRALCTPQQITYIRLPPESGQAGGSPDRAITRQAVRDHLRRLGDFGLVNAGAPSSGAVGSSYSLNHQRLFALIEEIRKLGRLRAPGLRDPGETADLGDLRAGAAPVVGAPHLLVVHGATEGLRFPLPRSGAPRWTLGRRAAHHVVVDWDPYVSSDHLVIMRESAGFAVEDFGSNRNGSSLNFARIPAGRTRIEHGDVLGVGKTLLVFRER